MSKWEEYAGSVEKSREYHERYHFAILNPTRRRILNLISMGYDKDMIREELKLSRAEFEYHLRVLVNGFCIEFKDGRFILTKEGRIIEHL